MAEPTGLAAVRRAVRRWLAAHGGGPVAVACSGGPDSLALAAAAAREAAAVTALVVDHGLQPGSAGVAARAAEQALALGCARAQVLAVVVDGPGGPEAAARAARSGALRAAAGETGAAVLLGHTRDDQAETVLLGLARGSGARSLAGMRAWDPPWGRPLLGVRRADTVAACAELGVAAWADPHNTDPAFTRVRLRHEVLPLLEDVLGGGVADALARTAAQLRDDVDALDAVADAVLGEVLAAPGGAGPAGLGVAGPAELGVAALAGHPAAVRRRVLRRWLLGRGARDLTDAQLRACDDLVGRWRGQGAVRLAGGLEVLRARGRLAVQGLPRPDDPPQT